MRVLRAGAVDARPADAAGRAALRPRAQLVPGAAGSGPTRFFPTPVDFPETQGRRQLQRHHAAHRRGQRRLRQRQDRAEVQPGQVPRGRRHRQPGCLLQHEPDAAAAEHEPAVRTARRAAHLDRCQRQLPSRLRSAEPEPAGPARQRRRLLRPDLEPRLRHRHADQHLRSRPHVAAGACGRRTGGSACRCSSSSCRARRSRSPTTAARSAASRSNDNQVTKAVGLHAVQHHGAARSAAAGRRRLHDLGPVRRRPGAVRPDQQPDHAGRQVRHGNQTFNGVRHHVERAGHAAASRSRAARARGRTSPTRATCGQRLPELNAVIGAGLVGSTVSPTSPYCHVDYGLLTQMRGLATYTIPRVDVQVSGVFQSKPGALLAANYAVPAAVIAQSLGRPPSGNVTNVTINLLEPGEQLRRSGQPARFPRREDSCASPGSAR